MTNTTLSCVGNYLCNNELSMRMLAYVLITADHPGSVPAARRILCALGSILLKLDSTPPSVETHQYLLQ